MPSLTFRERSASRTRTLIDRIAPGEILPAHLFFDPTYQHALEAKHVVHYFIYRDLRDVVVSEAYYLAQANRWHRLHRYFAALPTMEERISFSILGQGKLSVPYDYPDVAQRFKRFLRWLDLPGVRAVRYEDILSHAGRSTVRSLLDHYVSQAGARDTQLLADEALTSVGTRKAHTYRAGQAGGWRSEFTETHKRQMKDVAGGLLIELGYENGLDW
jgi:hypothetical protein